LYLVNDVRKRYFDLGQTEIDADECIKSDIIEIFESPTDDSDMLEEAIEWLEETLNKYTIEVYQM